MTKPITCWFGFHTWKSWEPPGQERFSSKVIIPRCTRCGKAPLWPVLAPGIREWGKQLEKAGMPYVEPNE